MHNLLRHIPSVDECLLAVLQDNDLEVIPAGLLKKGIRSVLEQQRRKVLDGRLTDSRSFALPALLDTIKEEILELHQPKFRRVVNGTGVIIHTNLGRSILPGDTLHRLAETGANYSNLEFDLETGKRGSRYALVEELLCELTGAEAGLVVNNNAAAVLLTLDTLAKGKEVIVSRGQLVEIGGSFRIPDVMARSGARMVEVGATNRTHLRDYRDALSPETGLLLKVHTSNYRIIGFTSEVSNKELVRLGQEHDLPVMEDLGSGCFVDLSPFGLMKEPTVQEVVASGIDVVTFSGDKLLGGPQAGIILGSKKLIERIRKNPMNRAMRIDKFTLSSLESILRFYRSPHTVFERIPTLNMISTPLEILRSRAELLAEVLEKSISTFCTIEIAEVMSRVGGGAMPEQNLPSRGVVLRPLEMKVTRLEQALRKVEVPVIGRVEHDRLIIDMRTVRGDELHFIDKGLRHALATGKENAA
ncbi:MAG: L-seryl-tRNA(Sec) selenium transferase [Candidatus Electrothrix sp. YB6]